MAKAIRIEKPIKALFGQEVKVGDKVVVVTTCTGSTHVKKGTYIGYVEGWRGAKRAQVQIESVRTAYIKPDGTEFDWRKDYNYATWNDVKHTLTTETRPHTYITTLQRNRIARIES